MFDWALELPIIFAAVWLAADKAARQEISFSRSLPSAYLSILRLTAVAAVALVWTLLQAYQIASTNVVAQALLGLLPLFLTAGAGKRIAQLRSRYN
jgi:hypothetical protein